ncbi:unnamed protein product [Callosobruchus maculatus]|uniref:Peroxisomal membrane protein PEX16 n=1 Tax=Callosobruchus maculatus TaxID=64391 RepID=A0A653D9U7_CALMS|nr:unnamed protein product [Callosobruchus maculatus]
MSTLLFSLPEFYNSYKTWVSKNPNSLGDWENTAKWVSYFIAGRINNSQIVSELIYCLSNLLVMLNDIIIKKSTHIYSNAPADKVKLWLTVLEYCEVFLELSANKLWGNTGKWVVVTSIQVFKCISRLILVYHYKENIIELPPIPTLNRQNLKNQSTSSLTAETPNQFEAVSFTLKRSGRIVRKVDSAPPIGMRSWKPLQPPLNYSCENDQSIEQALIGRQLIAETIYIAKPMVHLASMACFGSRAWKPYLIALAMDISSLQLYKSCKRNNLSTLTPQQRLQLSKRTLLLVLYLIRSPVYEKYSRDKINNLLSGLSKYVPLAGLVCNPLSQYMPYWQSMYFHMWST